jgi:hypothetical protein
VGIDKSYPLSAEKSSNGRPPPGRHLIILVGLIFIAVLVACLHVKHVSATTLAAGQRMDEVGRFDG